MSFQLSPAHFADALRGLVDVDGLTKEAALEHLGKEAAWREKVAADQQRAVVQGQTMYDSFFIELDKIASARTLEEHESSNPIEFIEYARS